MIMKKLDKTLSDKYPNIAWMIETGTIEITNEYGRGVVAYAHDEGGTIWEGDGFKNFDEAIEALEKGIEEWYDENM
jgi:hypothetical protein